MSEYVKDTSRPDGWKVISYGAKGKKSEKGEGAPITAEGMDEGGDEPSGDEAPDFLRSHL
jgi:hypothetical protein